MTVLEKILIELKDLNNKIEYLESLNDNKNPRMLDGKINLSTTEATDILGIGRNKLLELVHSKSIPHIKNGSKYLFPVDQLFNWINSKATENYITEDKSGEVEKMFKTIS